MDNAEYIKSFLSLDNMQLASISQEEQFRKNIQPSIGLEAGKLLGLLVRLIQAQRVLEFGTSIGYSTIWLAEALRSIEGRLISVEYDKDLYEETKRNIKAAGLSSTVELVWGDAQTVIKEVEGPFDMILQDSAKPLYPVLLERCVSLTRKNGLIIADDALFKPMGIAEKFSDPIHRYNELVFSDPRLYSTILPIGDGLAISLKLRD
jgi:predicted O-methyltransferase YrrM